MSDYLTVCNSSLIAPGLSEASYHEALAESQKLLDRFKSVETILNQAKSEMDGWEDKIKATEDAAKKVPLVLDQIDTELIQRKTQGYKVDGLGAWLATTRTQLEQANQLMTDKDIANAATALASLQKEASAKLAEARDLPNMQSKLQSKIVQCRSRIDQTSAAVSTGRTAFERLCSNYAEASWKAVRGNGTQAVEHVDWCVKAMPLAESCITMDRQNWQQASNIVTEASGHLDRAVSLMESITSLEQSLQTAKDQSTSDVAAAEKDIQAASQYIAEYGNDLDAATKSCLAEATDKLQQAEEELRRPKPEYFLVINLAKQAHGVADEVLAECRTEHEAAERLRQKSAQALRDATSRVSKARKYHEAHKKYIKREARENLSDAETWLLQAQQATDPNEGLKWAEKADDAGEKAYKKASNNVNAAVEASSPGYRGRSTYYAPSDTTVVVNNWPSAESVPQDSPNLSPSSSSGNDSSGGFDFGGGGGGADNSGSW
jgi:hypothetical protein